MGKYLSLKQVNRERLECQPPGKNQLMLLDWMRKKGRKYYSLGCSWIASDIFGKGTTINIMYLIRGLEKRGLVIKSPHPERIWVYEAIPLWKENEIHSGRPGYPRKIDYGTKALERIRANEINSLRQVPEDRPDDGSGPSAGQSG